MSAFLTVGTEENDVLAVVFTDVEIRAVHYPCQELDELSEVLGNDELVVLVPAEVDDLSGTAADIGVKVETDEISAAVRAYRYPFRIGVALLYAALRL